MPNALARRRIVAATGGGGPPDSSGQFLGTALSKLTNSSSDFMPAGAWSVAFWIDSEFLDAGNYDRLMGQDSLTNAHYGWYIQKAGTDDHFHMGYNNTALAFQDLALAQLTLNKWYLFLCTWATGAMNAWVYDTVGLVNSYSGAFTGTINTVGNEGLNVGGGVATTGWPPCRLDKIGFWSRTLVAADAVTLWNNGNGLTGRMMLKTSLASGLVDWLDMDAPDLAAVWPSLKGNHPFAAAGTTGVHSKPRAGLF